MGLIYQLKNKYNINKQLTEVSVGDFIIVQTIKGPYRSIFPGLVIKNSKKKNKLIVRNSFKKVLIEKSFNLNSPSILKIILFVKGEYQAKRLNLFFLKKNFQSFSF